MKIVFCSVSNTHLHTCYSSQCGHSVVTSVFNQVLSWGYLIWQTCTKTVVFICSVSTRSVICASHSMCSEIHCCMSSLFWGSETSTSDAAHPQTHNTTETQRWEQRNKPPIEHLSGPRQTDAHAPVYQCVPWVGPPAPASSSGLHLSSVRLCRTFLMQTYTQGQRPWMCNIKTETLIYVLSS